MLYFNYQRKTSNKKSYEYIFTNFVKFYLYEFYSLRINRSDNGTQKFNYKELNNYE